ncbi:ribonuclease HI [Bacteroidetes bacterium endosymbiont of Geopemphigus sp.]|uniref:ribonuclease HI n=1 Tax=Bacteroidetes bacterium endosymbiont of Geopemphigus sp. TaxID=2047937 RepID=UPI000CD02692|nr:RNase H family protein [Bacteroidetes bacterium endosymbiont of Geopemphigus sp.]
MSDSKNAIPRVRIYSDGSSRGNPGAGAYGLIMEMSDSGHRKLFSEAFRLTTNNRMELWGVIAGLAHLKQKSQVTVFTDSKYVTQAVDKAWVFFWEKSNFKGKKNSDLWRRFLKFYRLHQVSFKWIKGHNEHPENEQCDYIATQAAKNGPFKIDEIYESLQIPNGKISL